MGWDVTASRSGTDSAPVPGRVPGVARPMRTRKARLALLGQLPNPQSGGLKASSPGHATL